MKPIPDKNITSTHIVTLFKRDHPYAVELGGAFAPLEAAYETYGELNSAGSNAILVCHALTGSAHAGGFSSDDPRSAGWWEPMIGPGRALDTEKYFIVCSNILGSCYGTSGPISQNPATGKPYGMTFPQMTVRDMVLVQKKILDTLGIHRLRTVIGGSLGGMQALEWGLMFPEMVGSLIPIATAVQHSPWCIGLDEVQRQAIVSDPEWNGGDYAPERHPVNGLSIARQIAMISYRSDRSFLQRFGREHSSTQLSNADGTAMPFFTVNSYLHYQGKKLADRFDANTYLKITHAMDLHDIARGRGALSGILGSIQIPVLGIGIDTDILYPASEQRAYLEMIPHSQYGEIKSIHGHDAFLIEYSQLSGLVAQFLESEHAKL